jgi:hypothetical protein
MNEWEFPGRVSKGMRGQRVRQVQEWLCLHGLSVSTDGDFGPATQAALRRFQKGKGLAVSGAVNAATWGALVAPMTAAIAELAPASGLGQAVAACALQHLAQAPREVGGQNLGPWVRLYMKGNEGADWPWCAGFASFVLRQAARAAGAAAPLPYTFSCDSLAATARERGAFVPEREAPGAVGPGALFLSRRTPLDWVHTGIVIAATRDTFETIEGNTNDSGDREGYEVCRRIRGWAGKDFVAIP